MALSQQRCVMNLFRRPRRNRKTAAIRDLVAETTITCNSLVYPVFIRSGKGFSEPISTMPGQNRMSVDVLAEKIREWKSLGLKHYALFPQIEENKKDRLGREALNDNGLLATAIRE